MASFVMIWVWVQSRFAQATRDEEDLGGVSVGGLDGIQVGRGQGGQEGEQEVRGTSLGVEGGGGHDVVRRRVVCFVGGRKAEQRCRRQGVLRERRGGLVPDVA